MENNLNRYLTDPESKNILLPLIVSASVLRKKDKLKVLLNYAKKINFNGNKIYEAILQTYLFAGFPSALNSLKILSEYYPVSKNYEYENIEELISSGEKNCKKIYGNQFEKLITNVKEFSPELSKWLIIEGYGKVFNRKGLSIKDREICNVAVLTSLKFDEQLYSHINGAYRVKVEIDFIELVIKNLELIGGKSVVEFGMKILNEFLNKKF